MDERKEHRLTARPAGLRSGSNHQVSAILLSHQICLSITWNQHANQVSNREQPTAGKTPHIAHSPRQIDIDPI
jgi:hypothetical protein